MRTSQTTATVPEAGATLSLFARIAKKWRDRKTPAETHSKVGEDITEWESYVMATSRSGDVMCPDCQQGRLMEGPSGSGAVNCFCEHCPAAFNVFGVFPEGIWGERMPNRVVPTKS
jgi:hypothetical protein